MSVCDIKKYFKNHCRRRQKTCWRWAAHNHCSLYDRQNILRIKGSRHSTT